MEEQPKPTSQIIVTEIDGRPFDPFNQFRSDPEKLQTIRENPATHKRLSKSTSQEGA